MSTLADKMGLSKSLLDAVNGVLSEELSPKQKKIDKNKNGKIDGQDLATLRKEDQDLEEGGEQYKVKSIGYDPKKGDYFVHPTTGEKVYKSGVSKGDHVNPKTGEVKKKVAESETLDENDAAMKAHMNMGHRVKQNSDGTYTWFDDKNKIARKVDGKKQSSVKWTAKGKDESDPDNMDEEVKLQEGITPAQISRMKAEYSKIDRIDPSSDNYKKLISMLDKLGKPELQTLSDAGIKFVSGLAKNRVNRMGMKKEETQLDEGRPSQRHPLEGHDYHKKSDAALIHIGKDAHKAAEAMKGHNTDAENKYRDQANDAATVRYFRQKNGMPDWYKKKYGHDVKKEEVQLEQMGSPKSDSLERSYAKKMNKGEKQLTDESQPINQETKKLMKGQVTKTGVAKWLATGADNMKKEEKIPEFKSGGKPLEKKFNKAFKALGVDAKVKIKTVGNVSANEEVVLEASRVVKRVKDLAKKKMMKKEEETPSKANVGKGDQLTGKKEPIEINPEMKS